MQAEYNELVQLLLLPEDVIFLNTCKRTHKANTIPLFNFFIVIVITLLVNMKAMPESILGILFDHSVDENS